MRVYILAYCERVVPPTNELVYEYYGYQIPRTILTAPDVQGGGGRGASLETL